MSTLLNPIATQLVSPGNEARSGTLREADRAEPVNAGPDGNEGFSRLLDRARQGQTAEARLRSSARALGHANGAAAPTSVRSAADAGAVADPVGDAAVESSEGASLARSERRPATSSDAAEGMPYGLPPDVLPSQSRLATLGQASRVSQVSGPGTDPATPPTDSLAGEPPDAAAQTLASLAGAGSAQGRGGANRATGTADAGELSSVSTSAPGVEPSSPDGPARSSPSKHAAAHGVRALAAGAAAVSSEQRPATAQGPGAVNGLAAAASAEPAAGVAGANLTLGPTTGPTAQTTAVATVSPPALTPSLNGVDSTAGAAAAEASVHASPFTPGFAPELAARVSTFVRDGLQRAELQLHPADMGPVAVQIQLDGGNAWVNLGAERADTRSALEQSMPALAAALREGGFTLAGGGVFDRPQGGGAEHGPGSPTSRHSAGASPGERDDSGALRTEPPRRRGLVDLVA